MTFFGLFTRKGSKPISAPSDAKVLRAEFEYARAALEYADAEAEWSDVLADCDRCKERWTAQNRAMLARSAFDGARARLRGLTTLDAPPAVATSPADIELLAALSDEHVAWLMDADDAVFDAALNPIAARRVACALKAWLAARERKDGAS